MYTKSRDRVFKYKPERWKAPFQIIHLGRRGHNWGCCSSAKFFCFNFCQFPNQKKKNFRAKSTNLASRMITLIGRPGESHSTKFAGGFVTQFNPFNLFSSFPSRLSSSAPSYVPSNSKSFSEVPTEFRISRFHWRFIGWPWDSISQMAHALCRSVGPYSRKVHTFHLHT